MELEMSTISLLISFKNFFISFILLISKKNFMNNIINQFFKKDTATEYTTDKIEYHSEMNKKLNKKQK